MELADVIPHLGSVADDITLVRSMYTEHNNHTEALVMMSTGKLFQGRPSVGAWVSYALGTENQNLPAYVVLRDPDGYNNGGTTLWENGWLPALFRGTEIQSRGAAVLNLRPRYRCPTASSATTSGFSPASTTSAAASIRKRPSSTPAFATTSWPPACRPAPKRRSTSRAKRPPPAPCTASITR
jgi:hypothetical protein